MKSAFRLMIALILAIATSAKVPQRRSVCGEATTLTQQEKDALLNAHNFYRAREPDAIAMWKMTWNEEDARIAQEFANQCVNGHGMQTGCDGFHLGQNIYMKSGASFDDVTAAVDNWFSEINYYNYKDNSCTDKCGHYTQLVWGSSASVGCAVAHCTNQRYPWRLICNYRPAGNSNDGKPYTTGTPCTACDSTAVATGYKCVEGRFCAACTPETDKDCTCKATPDNCNHGSWNPNTCKCDCQTGWYGLLCDRSCTGCADKEGQESLCSSYSHLCSNDLYKAFMTENCAKTCNLCPPPPPSVC